MDNFLCEFLLPWLLIGAALANWSIISLVDLVAFLVIQFNLPRRDFRLRRLILFLWGISIYSLLVAFIQAIFIVTCAIKGGKWSLADASWVELIGLMKFHSWRSPTAIFYLVTQVIVGFVCLVWIYQHKLGLVPWQGSCWGNFSSILVQFLLQGCVLLPVACHPTGCGDKPSILGVFALFHL